MEENRATLVYQDGVGGDVGGKEITGEPRRREMAPTQCSE
jgi:hypothetical protein